MFNQSHNVYMYLKGLEFLFSFWNKSLLAKASFNGSNKVCIKLFIKYNNFPNRPIKLKVHYRQYYLVTNSAKQYTHLK